MSMKSVLSRIWAPAALTAVSAVPLGFAINFLSAGTEDWWWWWIVLVACTVSGLVGLGLATKFGKDELMQAPLSTGDGAARQTAGGDAISIRSDDHSIAAWHIGEVNLTRRRSKKPKR